MSMIKLYREAKIEKVDILEYERYGIDPYTRREYEPVKTGEKDALVFDKSIYIPKDYVSSIYKEDLSGIYVTCVCDKLGNKFYAELPMAEYVAQRGNLSINDCKRLMGEDYEE